MNCQRCSKAAEYEFINSLMSIVYKYLCGTCLKKFSSLTKTFYKRIGN